MTLGEAYKNLSDARAWITEAMRCEELAAVKPKLRVVLETLRDVMEEYREDIEAINKEPDELDDSE